MAQRTTATEPPWTRRQLPAPRKDFSILAEPPLIDAVDAAGQNHAALTALPIYLQGRTVEQLRKWTRTEVLQAAREYTSQLLDLPLRRVANLAKPKDSRTDTASPSTGDELFFVSGHQPALFHPGVWVKNFAVHELARRSFGISLNLSVDTDVMGSTSIRVPTGGRAEPRIELVRFDADRPRGPWEENPILDRAVFESFGSRVMELYSSWPITPLLVDFWPKAVRASQKFSLLRDCLVAARSRTERQWGAGNLELPISRMCELDPFLWFAGHILAHLPRFRDMHNQVLAEYRRVNRVRSRTHPVPELMEIDGWIEAPFWIWRQGDRVRGRLLARQSGREVLLSDGKQEFARLPLSPEMEACCAVEVLRELPRQGIRFRARALTTTLFSRLCLADLFVHGIGGAKYDEMTDRILARFFHVPIPSFLTLTATLHAGLADPYPVTRDDERRLQRQLRDLRWNSDRQLAAANRPEFARLVAEKQKLVAGTRAMASHAIVANQIAADQSSAAIDPSEPGLSGYERFRKIHDVNSRLATFAAAREREVTRELSEIRGELDKNALFQDREFAFCLYPADKLHRLMSSL